MRTYLILFITIFFHVLAKCQDLPTGQAGNQTQQNPSKVMNFKMVTQQEPFFPAGDQVFYTYVLNNIKYSEEAKAKNINGNVMVSFEVMPDSTLSEISVLSGVGYGVDQEIVRLLAPLKYAPAIVNGEKTKMNVIITINITAK